MKSESSFHIDGNNIEGVLVKGNQDGSDSSQKSINVEYDSMEMEVTEARNVDGGAECSKPEQRDSLGGNGCDVRADSSSQVSTGVMNPLAGVKEFACFACEYRSTRMEDVVKHILSAHPAPQPKTSLVLVQQPNSAPHSNDQQGMMAADCQPAAINNVAASNFIPAVKAEVENDPSTEQLVFEPKEIKTESADEPPIQPSELPSTVSAASPGEKNFAGDHCKVCGHVFLSTADAEQHMNIHWEPLGPIGTKRFPCIVCNFRTKEKSCLTRHLLTHFGRKPFACDVCGARFNRKDSLMKHLRTHTRMKQPAGKTGGDSTESSMAVGTTSSERNSFSGDFESNSATDVEPRVPSAESSNTFGTTVVLLDPSNSTATLDGYGEPSEPPDDIVMSDIKTEQTQFDPDGSQNDPLQMDQSEEQSQDSDPSGSFGVSATGNKLLSCTFCPYETRKNSEFVIHARTHTGETPFACDLCDKKYIARKTLNRHKKKHHGETLLVCGLCDYRTVQKSDMDLHIRSHHEGITIEPNALGAQDASNLDLGEVSLEGGPSWSYEAGEPEAKCYKCGLCHYQTNQERDLESHLKTHTGENLFECEFCDRKYTAKRTADRHVRECHGEKLFGCDLCDYKAVKKSDLTEHVKTHVKSEAANHSRTEVDEKLASPYESEMNDLSSGPSECTQPGNDPFQSEFEDVPCELTNDAFQLELSNEHSQDSGVSRSSEAEVRNKRHTCDVCGYKTSRKYEYTVHMRTHTGEKPYKCSLCDYRTVRKSYVAKHMKTHLRNPTSLQVETTCDSPENNGLSETTPWRSISAEEHFKCKYCDYECDSITEWSQHMFEHTEKTYSCNECDFKTKDKSDMVLHSCAHVQKITNTVKITCEFCDYLFITKEDMSHHIMMSHPEKCHNCDICDFKAFNPKSLEIHKETHTKPYACGVCDYRTDEESLLSNHVMSAHGNAEEYVCYSCDFKASTVTAVEEHIFTTHSLSIAETAAPLISESAVAPSEAPILPQPQVQEYLCYACDFKATELTEVEQHILVTHPTPVVEEVAVPLVSLNPEAPDFLTSASNIRGEYFCITCSYKAKTIPELEQHIRNCQNIKCEPTN